MSLDSHWQCTCTSLIKLAVPAVLKAEPWQVEAGFRCTSFVLALVEPACPIVSRGSSHAWLCITRFDSITLDCGVHRCTGRRPECSEQLHGTRRSHMPFVAIKHKSSVSIWTTLCFSSQQASCCLPQHCAEYDTHMHHLGRWQPCCPEFLEHKHLGQHNWTAGGKIDAGYQPTGYLRAKRDCRYAMRPSSPACQRQFFSATCVWLC